MCSNSSEKNYHNGYSLGVADGLAQALSKGFNVKITAHFHDIGEKTFNSQEEYNTYMTAHSARDTSDIETTCFTIKNTVHHDDSMPATCTLSVRFSHDRNDSEGDARCTICGRYTRHVYCVSHNGCGIGDGWPVACSNCWTQLGGSHTYYKIPAYDETVYLPSCGYNDGEITSIQLSLD